MDEADRAELAQWRTLCRAVGAMALSETARDVPLWPNKAWTGDVAPMAKLLHALLERPRTISESVLDALEFYADPHSYFAIMFLADPPCGAFADDLSESDELGREVPGKRARDTLAWLDTLMEETADTPEVEALFELIGNYWTLAYSEGKEGREQDTEAGDAAATWHDIQRGIRRLALGAMPDPESSDENQ